MSGEDVHYGRKMGRSWVESIVVPEMKMAMGYSM
jgi:hypothetical protein